MSETTFDGVRIRGLKKRYGSTVALAGIDMDIAAGTIHGIAGPNGAGKSTLMKVLAGEELADEGVITVMGDVWTPSIGAHRIAVVHQEPGLFPNLTVGENMAAPRSDRALGWPGLVPDDLSAIEKMGLSAYVKTPVGSLPLAYQQRTEIARALAHNADVVLFDEPNSALTVEESTELFSAMRELAADGKCVIVITHRLAELASIADIVSIVVDGEVRTNLTDSEITADRIGKELVVGGGPGSDDTADRRVHELQDREITVGVKKWHHAGGAFGDIALDFHHGEVVAIVGVEGSGSRELVRSLVGFERASGERVGVGLESTEFVPADRSDSLFGNLSVGENSYVRLNTRIRGRTGLLKSARARDIATDLKSRFGIKAASIDSMIRELSGGNQQKVAIAAALAAEPELLVIEEPTRGVDIGSKGEIYRLVREFARSGGCVILYCTESSEAFDVGDRVVVVGNGTDLGEIIVSDIDDAASLAEQIAILEARSTASSIGN